MNKTTTLTGFPLLLISFLALVNVQFTHAQAQEATYQSMIIVKVSQMTGTQYKDITSGIAKIKEMTFEYACQESGIVVVQYHHNHAEKADVQSTALPLFRKWAKTQKVALIYLDVKEGGTNKC